MEDEGAGEKEDEGDKREIGKLAVWSVSSFKPGNGVDLLRDCNIETYWQSDGAQPHVVNIQFQKKVRLQQLALYVDFKLDESYTPNKISVRAGNSFHDLREIKVVELAEPIGWVNISLCPSDSKECRGSRFHVWDVSSEIFLKESEKARSKTRLGNTQTAINASYLGLSASSMTMSR